MSRCRQSSLIGALATFTLALAPIAGWADTSESDPPEEAAPVAEIIDSTDNPEVDTADGDAAEVDTATETREPVAQGTPRTSNIVLDLYNLTDVHGHITQKMSTDKKTGEKYVSEAGLAAVGCYLNQARTDNPNSSFTLLGDNIGASPWISGSQDDNPTIAALNLLKPLASTIGNHELDWGQQVFKDRIDGLNGYTKVEFPYLGANVHGLGDYLGDYVIWESPSGIKVAFMGGIAQDVPYKLSPGTTAGMTFDDPIPVLNDLAKSLKDSGQADIAIAMLDDDVKNNLPHMGSYIDGLMGGDTHVPYAFTMADGANGHKLSGIASGSYTDNLANLRLVVNPETKEVISSEAILISAADLATCEPEDAAIKAVVDEAVANAEVEGAKVMATDVHGPFLRGVLENDKGELIPGGNRGIESTLGNLAADSMRAMITGPDGKPVDIGIINAGGLRADLLAEGNQVTKADIFNVMPFSNYVGYVTITGQDFIDALDQQWKTDLNSQNSRPLLKLGISDNVQYTYDPTLPYGERITSVLVNGAPIDPAKKYTVGSVTFLLAGGDSFDALTRGGKPVIREGLDRDLFAEYLANNAPITKPTFKHAIGVSAPDVSDGEPIVVNLRGLSFSENALDAKQVRIQVGDFPVQDAAVNNTLADPNANNEAAIVTTDGVGQASFEIPTAGAQLCTAETAGKAIALPIQVWADYGADFVPLVDETNAVSAFVNCAPAKDPSPAPSDPTTPPAPGHDGKLADTGSQAKAVGIAAVVLLLIGVGAVVARKYAAKNHADSTDDPYDSHDAEAGEGPLSL